MLLDRTGRNIPLDALPRRALARIAPACDAWGRDAVAALRPSRAVALGRSVEARALALDLGVPIVRVRHPSPVHPANEAGWGEEVDALLDAPKGL